MWATALDGLRADASGALIIATAIVTLFVASELWARFGRDVPPEWTRKFTHVGAGVVVMGFPWLVDSVWTVLLLAVAFGGLLVLGKVTGLLSGVHGVQRKTGGAYMYPLAVLGIFVISDGDPLTFCVPLAVMAVADTGAALVGKHAGGVKYRVLDGERSLEGSLTFFALAFGILLVGMGLAGVPGWPAALLVALVGAVLTTAVEAVSVRGSDNLLIPYAAWLTLDRTLDLGLAGLSPWLLGMWMTGGVLALTWKQAGLTVAGGVTVFLVGSLGYAAGGWMWVLPFASVYALFLLTKLPRDATDLDDVFSTTAGSLAVLLVFAHTQGARLLLPFLVTVSANGAILMVFMTRSWAQRVPWIKWLAPVAAVLGAGVPLIPGVVTGELSQWWIVGVGGLLGLVLFLGADRLGFKGRRLAASLAVGVLAWLLL